MRKPTHNTPDQYTRKGPYRWEKRKWMADRINRNFVLLISRNITKETMSVVVSQAKIRAGIERNTKKQKETPRVKDRYMMSRKWRSNAIRHHFVALVRETIPESQFNALMTRAKQMSTRKQQRANVFQPLD